MQLRNSMSFRARTGLSIHFDKHSLLLALTAAVLALPLAPTPARATHCADVECGDLDGSGTLGASDALRLLRRVVGIDNELVCPNQCVAHVTTTTISTTTTTTTTTTTLAGPQDCTVLFRLDEFIDVVGVSLDVDYSAVLGELVGDAQATACTPMSDVPLFFADHSDERLLSVDLYSATGIISGPVDFLSCEFRAERPSAADFSIEVRDVVRDFTELRSGGSGVCAAPETGIARPTVRDGILAQRAALGAGSCSLCECDVTGDGGVFFSDALAIAKASLGLPVELLCPSCGYPPEIRTLGEPVSIVVSGIGCRPASPSATSAAR